MKIRKRFSVAVFALVLVTASLGTATQQAERSGAEQGQHGMMAGDMAQECRSMMSARKQMMSQMKESQQEMSALVEKMRQATGDAKVEAIEEVVSTMVSQRKRMMEQMAEMQPRMMGHMMRHMQMSMSKGDGPASSCPMMKEMMSKPQDDSNSGS